MSTYMPKPGEIQRNWRVIDAKGQVLGRLAARIALILQGKDKPTYTPHVDTGDFVIVINAEKVKLTGAIDRLPRVYIYCLQTGGMLEMPYRVLLQKRPTLAVEHAVKGMLPKNPLGRQMFTKLKVYAGGAHPHAAQKPEPLAAV